MTRRPNRFDRPLAPFNPELDFKIRTKIIKNLLAKDGPAAARYAFDAFKDSADMTPDQIARLRSLLDKTR